MTESGKDCNTNDALPSTSDPLDKVTSLPYWSAGITGSGQVIQMSDTGLDIDNYYFYDKRAKCSTNFVFGNSFDKDCR
jgi:hypothetical protein